MSKLFVLLTIWVCAFSLYAQTNNGPEITQGSLFAYDKKGKELGDCPLKSTSVKTDIAGFIARVDVRQEFENSFAFPIEAVYTFPLSQKGAVDDMTMTIGTRVIHAKIMKRQEARQVYEQAKTEGKTASLLDQERPNIFTQSVANIMPGDKVVIEISYVETLKYEDGAYEFVFPMTVGPRYIPASGVKDASKIRPRYAATRNGSDISMEVNLNAGVPVEEIRSTSHDIAQTNFAANAARITLKDEKTIPNKDFILHYDVTGGKIQDALLTHRDERGGFFTLILQPPDRIASDQRTPKEIVFVLDTSGSMSGFPIEKAKEAMKLSIDGLYPDDTFNLITFAGDTSILFDEPVPATQENIERAKAFIESRQGSGGTEMMKAIKAALDPSDSKEHVRIVCFMTDGYVGNENEIIAEVQRHPQARVFSFGIGSSVNRFLLDKMAEAGRGEVEYVALEDDGSKAAKKFYERVRTPLLTDLSIDWNGLPVSDVYPSKLTDLFSAKPVIVHGRFTKSASGVIRLKGKMAGQDQVREIAVNFPDSEPANEALASLWARTRIDELSSDSLRQTNPARSAEYDKQIEQLGLEYRLMTNFTSFVAVEDRVVNQNSKPVTIQVPVEVPAGVDPTMSGALSDQSLVTPPPSTQGNQKFGRLTVTSSLSRPPGKTKGGNSSGSGNGVGYGQGSGSGGGTGNGSGSGSGSGSGIGPVSATVEVTADSPNSVNNSSTAVTTTISRDMLSTLPTGTVISGRSTGQLVTMNERRASRVDDREEATTNGFPIDGREIAKIGLSSTLSGRAIQIVEPAYPSDAKAAKATGEVEVAIKIDHDGNVSSATPVSGPETLRKTSEAAAMISKFTPVLVEGRAIRVSGIIAYNFKSADKTFVFLRKMKAEPLTDEDRKAYALAKKLHVWLYQIAMRIQRNDLNVTANEIKFVRGGKANVEMELTALSDSVREKLRAAGFEIASEKGNRITGSISPDKLASLADIEEVKLVLPSI